MRYMNTRIVQFADRFEVQLKTIHFRRHADSIVQWDTHSVFDSLDKAREARHEIELNNGIVIE